MNHYAKVTAIGSYVPEKRLTNEALTKRIDTSDEWIVQRTGMKERRIAADDEFASDVGANAARNLAARFNIDLTDVDFIIACTMSPDYHCPSTAALIQTKLDIIKAGALDVNAACAGFTYGLHLANALITAGLHKKVLVVGTETLSRITDYTDRTTCILFGDGAGAVLVEAAPNRHFIHHYERTEGDKSHHLFVTNTTAPDGKFVQNGREVYKWAVSTVPRGVKTLLEEANMTLDDIDWFVPHSANLRMIEAICARLDWPLAKTLYSLEYFGNTSAATIPLALDLGVQDGRVKRGDKLLLFGFGGGLTQCGQIMEW